MNLLTLTINNDNQSSSLSGVISIFKVVYDWKAELTFYVDDHRETFKTSINMANVFAGFRGVYLMTSILKNFVKSFDMGDELRFPLTPRNYTLNNMTIPSNSLPPLSVMFVAELKNWMNIISYKSRKMEFAAAIKLYGKLN